MKVILVTLISMILLTQCEKNSQKTANAEIIRFNPDKCMCCWGWEVKIGEDTVKIDSMPGDLLIGHEVCTPIPVYIELGSKKRDCSSLKKYDYYNIRKIEVIH
jgi:hypothetical protein